MDSRPAHLGLSKRRGAARQAGFTTIQYVLAVALSFVFLVLLANLIVIQYGQGVVRAAVDEGARVGATVDGTATDCEARARRALDDLIGGSMRDGVAVHCEERDDVVVAVADVRFASWMPAFMDDTSFRSTATVVKEHGP